MPPRLAAPLRLAVRIPRCSSKTTPVAAALYSTATASDSNQPLITVTQLPAPGSGHIRILELNRPKARNAISGALLSQLRAEIDDIHSQYTEEGDEVAQKQTFGGAAGVDAKGPTRALILASAVETSFCAGADLKERRGFTQEQTDIFLSNLRGTFNALQNLPIPTISAISSLALGGGLELALSTHFRVLSSNALIGLPETRLGIIPGAGGTHRLPALIGISRARDLILTGRRVSAPEAYFLGIADRLVEITHEEAEKLGEGDKDKGVLLAARKAVLSESVRLAGEICEGGPIAIRAGLQAVNWAREEVENKMYERVVATEDRNEALKAFQEKRKPVFKGR
ncbi:mitochondrial methylglutaconyl-hydratase [Colletotrichum truncatum]|uniref:Mitochondrial methylglutaconyl-hydratase n=1 Tax=Colletotrichum truncatum TaxID=5467 RepID=A0ACC3Z6R3_COLTU|nr:mitochondrial methylglutaconyl-hydratase [Colletotrichum truncatum]KAF6787977.1 mitochondrial methylglutaconyl-hydratase [Colletotrichum truncatum]